MLDGSYCSETIDYVPYSEIWTNLSIHMLLKTSNTLFLNKTAVFNLRKRTKPPSLYIGEMGFKYSSS